MVRTLLFTGASGFVGRGVLPHISDRYDVTTLGRSDVCSLRYDLAAETPLLDKRYDVVFHAAGKSHSVPQSVAEESEFFDVNYIGTVNLCKALEKAGAPSAFVYLSTVSVYGLDQGDMIDESYPLSGKSPYAKSKIMAEQYLHEWCDKHGVILTILRSSLVFGEDAPGNLGAMICGIQTGHYLSIGKATSRKSIVSRADIASAFEVAVYKGGIYNICCEICPTFKQIEHEISKMLGKRPPISMPMSVARLCAKIGDILGPRFPLNSSRLDKITKSLTFSSERARRELGWEPASWPYE